MQQNIETLLQQLQTPQPLQPPPSQPTPKLTCIQRATNLVDDVTNSLYLQILNGLQSMQRRRSMQEQEQTSPKQHKNIQQRTVDIDLHKRMVRKFMRMNRKSLKSIEQRSVQFEEVARKCKEEEAMRRNQQKNKTLEVRREKISERLKSKERFKQELHRMARDSNLKISSVKNTKFLYQEKEEAFKKEFILPRIQEEKRILSKIKERVKPMDMTEILEHQKSYEEKLINDRLNRSLTSRVLQNDNFYEPPKYVAKAFLIAEAEQDLKREQQKLKEQTLEINQFRKKEFIKIVEEKQRQELERIKESNFQHNRSNRTYSIQGQQSKRERQKSQLSREQTKNIGNQYMKQLVNLNRMHRSKPSLLQDQQPPAQHPKSQHQIQLIKEERIEQVQKIRLRKIQDILNSNKLDDHFKLQRLQHQNDKFQSLLSRQHQDQLLKKSQADQLASIVLSSIHTKLAILQVTSPK